MSRIQIHIATLPHSSSSSPSHSDTTSQFHALVWNADDAVLLRSKHRIQGQWSGTLPSHPSQNQFMGLPLIVALWMEGIRLSAFWGRPHIDLLRLRIFSNKPRCFKPRMRNEKCLLRRNTPQHQRQPSPILQHHHLHPLSSFQALIQPKRHYHLSLWFQTLNPSTLHPFPQHLQLQRTPSTRVSPPLPLKSPYPLPHPLGCALNRIQRGSLGIRRLRWMKLFGESFWRN
ncbi:hypothetical protein BC829DRAFT_387387 [Chytridium lagenaria]|nr:hypothetical protein BC829DRAFT_387387 [Chytridium lagenaria]